MRGPAIALLALTACTSNTPIHPIDPGDTDPTDDPGDPDTDPDTDTDAISTWDQCFAELAGDGTEIGPDYAPFDPVIGTHCNGTNHQDIAGVERVVFLGDSITVGTPPTANDEFYRSRLADDLAWQLGLDAPDLLWEGVNPFSGETLVMQSGDFASCARWGARTDDLQGQLDACFPPETRDRTTLVVMTMGGNDLNSITGGFSDGTPHAELWAQTEQFMQYMRDAVDWLEAPGRFPAGVFVIFTNLYEFTDATGDLTACPTAALAGYDGDVNDPALAQMVVWSMEEYMSIAVDHQVDMLFLLETFCGHGYRRDDPAGRCYRGPEAELWFDVTCIHPNPVGHRQIADMFLSVVDE